MDDQTNTTTTKLTDDHTHWLQPWFFSMFTPHLGHGLVLAMIHVTFSHSALFFNFHCFTSVQLAGRCASSAQAKQKECPQLHSTSMAPPPGYSTAISQPAAGHQRHDRLISTKERSMNEQNFVASWWCDGPH